MCLLFKNATASGSEDFFCDHLDRRGGGRAAVGGGVGGGFVSYKEEEEGAREKKGETERKERRCGWQSMCVFT